MGDMPLRFRGNGRDRPSLLPRSGGSVGGSGRVLDPAVAAGKLPACGFPSLGPGAGKVPVGACVLTRVLYARVGELSRQTWRKFFGFPDTTPRPRRVPSQGGGVCRAFQSADAHSARLCTDPCRQSMETFIPSCKVRVAPMAPTMTALFRLSPTTAAWLPMPFSSVMTPMASRM